MQSNNLDGVLIVDKAPGMTSHDVVAIVRENCHGRTQTVSPIPPVMEPGQFFLPYPLEVEVGGAVLIVVPVERFERI